MNKSLFLGFLALASCNFLESADGGGGGGGARVEEAGLESLLGENNQLLKENNQLLKGGGFMGRAEELVVGQIRGKLGQENILDKLSEQDQSGTQEGADADHLAQDIISAFHKGKAELRTVQSEAALLKAVNWLAFAGAVGFVAFKVHKKNM